MLRGKALESHLCTVVEGLIDTAYVHSEYRHSPAVVETSLGYTPKHRHRPTLEVGLTAITAAALVTLMASSGSFAVTTTWAATDSFPFAVLKDPAMDIVEVHGETRSNLISVTLFNLDSVEAGTDLRQTSLISADRCYAVNSSGSRPRSAATCSTVRSFDSASTVALTRVTGLFVP